MTDYINNARAACYKIKKEFANVDSSCALLCFGVIERAIIDYAYALQSNVLNVNAQTARNYLRKNIKHAELCGISQNWLRNVLRKCDIDLYKDGLKNDKANIRNTRSAISLHVSRKNDYKNVAAIG